MSVTASAYQPQINAALLSGREWLPPPLPAPINLTSLLASISTPDTDRRLQLHVEVPGLGLVFGARLEDLEAENEYRKLTAWASIYPGVSAVLILKNRVVDEAGHLRTEEVSLNFDVREHTPKPHFVAASLYAALGLGGPVRIILPDLLLDLGVEFSMAMPAISTVLQERQTHFGLAVIERAAGTQIHVPEFIPGEDMNDISFIYRAIVERQFDGLVNYATIFTPATEEFLKWAHDPRSNQPNEFVVGPAPASRTIFGRKIALGPQTILIPDGVINNLEEARRELAKLDGELVPVVIRPLNRIGRYHLPLAPSLSETPWDPVVEACISLEDALNHRLTQRYNALAAATLAGLSPEEIEVATTRPVLEDEEGVSNE